MTEEEKARESYLNTTEETQWSEESEIEYTRGYLAGLQWHNLRKDPNDLPKDNKREYLVFLDWLGKKYELLRLCEIKTHKDTAWCEIPQFKE